MILSDKTIKEKVDSKEISIEPFDPENLQPASYDLHLDNRFKIFKHHKTEVIDTKKPLHGLMEDIDVKDEEPFVLHPGNFALALIREKTGVDNKHVARLEGKSSLARLGLIVHTTAGFLDPGNEIKMTLELYNTSPLPIKLYPGMKIAQMAFEEISSECENPYGSEKLGSKYYGSEDVEESKMHLNFEQTGDK